MEKDKLQEKSLLLSKSLAIQSVFEKVDYTPVTPLSDMPDVAMFQDQSDGYCKETKSNLAIGKIGSKHHDVVFATKQDIIDYLSNPDNRDVKSMKKLYDSGESLTLSKQISMLTFHAMYRDLVTVDDIPEETRKRALDMNIVSKVLCLYTYLVLLANNSCDIDYDELFIEAWYDYYGSLMARQVMLKMRGDDWIDDFDGAFLPIHFLGSSKITNNSEEIAFTIREFANLFGMPTKAVIMHSKDSLGAEIDVPGVSFGEQFVAFSKSVIEEFPNSNAYQIAANILRNGENYKVIKEIISGATEYTICRNDSNNNL